MERWRQAALVGQIHMIALLLAQGEAQAVGWYTTLRQLVQLGILRNHPDLDRALGWQHRDGKAATPRDAHARVCTAELIPAKWWVPEGVGLR